ncbi:hypothetical protein [Streptoalloteichus hindustanus]|uniref:Uncharacterized protein n=1 Tax=Streptoalloteichus hindustanus TaxID=2017 RepID=A0A1M5CU30_STRHI|nr:hypothetical protein [Streptoalloteichus hindustanus]SHF58225.1 hypothetical protein SAMN05444320_104168 [Streptoalloteichus hindustanus]
MSEKAVWEVRLGLYATEEEATRIVERITALLCPDPEHESPCPVPWSVALTPEEDLDEEDYAELREQHEIESRPPTTG